MVYGISDNSRVKEQGAGCDNSWRESDDSRRRQRGHEGKMTGFTYPWGIAYLHDVISNVPVRQGPRLFLLFVDLLDLVVLFLFSLVVPKYVNGARFIKTVSFSSSSCSHFGLHLSLLLCSAYHHRLATHFFLFCLYHYRHTKTMASCFLQ
jgi:hypothetical protein